MDGSSSIITTTGPFELSGLAAGVSVEGPIASVSARVRLVGGAGFADEVAAVEEPGSGLVSDVCGTVTSAGAAVVAGMAVSETCAVVFAAGASPDGGNVFISTGLDERSSCVFSVRDPAIACCGLL